MRRNGYSQAYRDFSSTIQRAARLQKIEQRLYSDPPVPRDLASVEALRGGAAVLLVSSLESYYREALAEFIELIAGKALVTAHANLPSHFVPTNDLNFLNWLLRDGRMDKPAKLAEVRRAAALISQSKFIPESFNRTRANPGPETVKTLLKELGINDPFRAIESKFSTHYPNPFASGFVESTLRTIVGRRNDVAHGSSSLNISRVDLQSWLLFMNALAKSSDNIMRDHCLSVVAAL